MSYWMDEEFESVSAEDHQGFIDLINEDHGWEIFEAKTTSLRKRSLPFYEDYCLMEAVEFAAIPPMTMRFLVKEREVVKLTGCPEPLVQVGSRAVLLLNASTVAAYARFFLRSLMTEEGSFRLVESMEEVEFNRDPTDDQIRQLLETVRPATVQEREGGFVLDAIVLYDDCVFRADLRIDTMGKLDILEEDVLLEDMPTREIILR